MNITSEIWQVGGGGFTKAEDAAVYLIHADGRSALVDAGCGNSVDRLLANIKGCGVAPETVEYLLITHCHFDHTGGAKELRQRLGCQTVCHELDAPYLEKGDDNVTAASWYHSSIAPFTIDRKLTLAGESIALGSRFIEALHAPGHSPGSAVYLMESDGRRVLFGQDVHGPLHPDLKSNTPDYIKSLEMMMALEADILCEGHYGVFKGKDRVRAFIASFL